MSQLSCSYSMNQIFWTLSFHFLSLKISSRDYTTEHSLKLIMNALFNALYRTLFPSKSARTLTHLIFAKNVRNNYGLYNICWARERGGIRRRVDSGDHGINTPVFALSRLHSTARGGLLVPRTKTKTIGPRSFATSGPALWNNLPEKNIAI